MFRKNWGKLLIATILVAIITYSLWDPSINTYIKHPGRIREYILSFGFLAPIIFILLYSIRALLFVCPISIFAIISGSLFGLWPGFFYSMIGAFISATIAFFIGRYLARDFVKQYFSKHFYALENKEIKGFKIVLFLRLIMIMPFDALSYVTGVTKISYKNFILGTILGISAEFFMYSYLGYIGVRRDISLKEKIIISLVLICVVICIISIKKIFMNIRNKKRV